MKTAATVFALFVGSYAVTVAPPRSNEVRSGVELCTELTREVNLSVQSGLLSQEEADSLSARCFNFYGDLK